MLDPRRTLAVLCGAQSWPHLAHFEPAAAFSNSATALRSYLGDADGAGLPDENVLWLFDEPNAVAHYERIAAFLTARLAALDAPQGADTLVLFAYIGHGTFFGPAKEYCLLVTDTRAPIEADTSLRLSTLAGLLRACAPRSSRLLLLDCCFAGVAATYFYQSGGPREIASAKAAEIVRATPGDRGVAILCAASAVDGARLADPSTVTLFHRELLAVLAAGDPETPGALSPRRVCDLVYAALLASGAEHPPRPEVHVPDQSGGDLGNAAIFPNRAAPRSADERGPAGGGPDVDGRAGGGTGDGGAGGGGGDPTSRTGPLAREAFLNRVTMLLRMRQGTSFHVVPDIPLRLSDVVRGHHAMADDERLLAVLDLSFFRRGKLSAAFTDRGFRYRASRHHSSALNLPYDVFPRCTFGPGFVERGTPSGQRWKVDAVTVTTPTRTAVLDFPNMPSGTVPAMRQLLKDIADLVAEHQGATGDQR
ncbi:hypothetical protein ACFOOK_17835 [Micromonospora krabiensis]|uniref:Caspase domain-containing protein n=1 Tax=Micromonospora krabiensis TaxID=307121 RepID=A0A1C3MZH1_9ACTN|nr:hypothetical protein [Micromonospora krabiensis]SBV25695.1 hypothetical protein GA0070620_1172 [Micromonospora krabiensis]